MRRITTTVFRVNGDIQSMGLTIEKVLKDLGDYKDPEKRLNSREFKELAGKRMNMGLQDHCLFILFQQIDSKENGYVTPKQIVQYFDTISGAASQPTKRIFNLKQL